MDCNFKYSQMFTIQYNIHNTTLHNYIAILIYGIVCYNERKTNCWKQIITKIKI